PLGCPQAGCGGGADLASPTVMEVSPGYPATSKGLETHRFTRCVSHSCRRCGESAQRSGDNLWESAARRWRGPSEVGPPTRRQPPPPDVSNAPLGCQKRVCFPLTGAKAK